jgi:hypothetical protein
MDINKLTIGEAKEIVSALGGGLSSQVVQHGFNIVVLDRGFVYVGEVITDEKFVRITNARNIRRWGTERGLGQLALNGPQENTKLDNCGDICAPIGELKHLMRCEEEKWTS